MPLIHESRLLIQDPQADIAQYYVQQQIASQQKGFDVEEFRRRMQELTQQHKARTQEVAQKIQRMAQKKESELRQDVQLYKATGEVVKTAPRPLRPPAVEPLPTRDVFPSHTTVAQPHEIMSSLIQARAEAAAPQFWTAINVLDLPRQKVLEFFTTVYERATPFMKPIVGFAGGFLGSLAGLVSPKAYAEVVELFKPETRRLMAESIAQDPMRASWLVGSAAAAFTVSKGVSKLLSRASPPKVVRLEELRQADVKAVQAGSDVLVHARAKYTASEVPTQPPQSLTIASTPEAFKASIVKPGLKAFVTGETVLTPEGVKRSLTAFLSERYVMRRGLVEATITAYKRGAQLPLPHSTAPASLAGGGVTEAVADVTAILSQPRIVTVQSSLPTFIPALGGITGVAGPAKTSEEVHVPSPPTPADIMQDVRLYKSVQNILQTRNLPLSQYGEKTTEDVLSMGRRILAMEKGSILSMEKEEVFSIARKEVFSKLRMKPILAEDVIEEERVRPFSVIAGFTVPKQPVKTVTQSSTATHAIPVSPVPKAKAISIRSVFPILSRAGRHRKVRRANIYGDPLRVIWG